MPLTRSHHSLRIISGTWRHRRLDFYPAPGVRPTPDRVRETVFNWLQSVIAGMRCLDLFAGSGILGLEAESRGAASVVWVESHPLVAQDLKKRVQLFQSQGQVIQADALQWLKTAPPQPFDLVFLDPPYQHHQLARSIEGLMQRDWLATPAWIYAEHALDQRPAWPPSWQCWRAGKTRQTCYQLFLKTH